MSLVSLPRLVARRLGAGFIALAVALTAAFAQSPSALDGFNPDVDGNVYVLAAQADGKLLVGGQFAHFRLPDGALAPRANLARLNPDGSLDDTFNPTANGPVRAIVVQADGRILIGGDFTSLQPGAAGTAVARGRLARLLANGTVDTAFNPNLGGAVQPQVHALLLQADGRIVAGGTFTTAQPGATGTAVTRNHLARFNADGSLDAAFNPNPNAIVLALAAHVDNKIVVAGGFTTLQPTGAAEATARNRLARLNADGTVDSEFNPDANNGVTALAVQRDGKILLGGFFTTLQPVGDTSPAGRQRLARLNVDGTLDSEFIPRADGSVMALAVQSDGSILVGGAFNNVWGRGSATASRSYVARLAPDGSLDAGFAPAFNGNVAAFAFQPDGKTVVGGYFTQVATPGAASSRPRNRLARLNADGSLDLTFELDAGGRPLASVTQADGKIVIAGSFTNVGGATRNYVARLNADGSLDPTYNPDFNGRVLTLALQPDGKVIVGGAFTAIGGETRNRLARLNPSGTIDSEFNPGFDGQVGTVLLQSDGKMLVGGSFTNVTPARTSTSTARSNLARLNADGSLDTAFDPSPNSAITALALQSDGKILVGGQFSAFTPGFAANTAAASTSRSFIARLNADGTVDTAYEPATNGSVSAIAVQSDGKAILGGAFTSVFATGATEAVARNRIMRLNTDGSLDAAYNPNANRAVLAVALQADGKAVIGGPFTTLQPGSETVFTLRKYAARLNADGTVDATFDLDLNEENGNRVDSLRVASDGRIYIGGNFVSLAPIGASARIPRRNFARLNANGTLDTAFDPGAGGTTGAVVNAFAVQADNKVIAVGNFADLGGAKSVNIARFTPEGSPDGSFSPSLATDGAIAAVAVRPDAAATPSPLAGFAWLAADGTLRPGFASATRLSGTVSAIAVDAEGRLLLGGSFANVGGSTGGNLVRVSAAGAIDLFFNPAPNGEVTGILVQADGRIVIVGGFTTVNGTARNRIARINADGTLDTAYDPNANARIAAAVLEGDGRIVVAGAFTTLQPNLAATSTARNFVARLNADGTLDANYNPSPNFSVNALALQADGKLVIAGGFTTVQPNGATTAVTRNALARLNTDGTVDQNFDPNPNGPVNAVVALANGQFVIGGGFTTVQPNGGAVVTRNYLARINGDGTLDDAFNPNPDASVATLGLAPGGAVYAAGSFSSVRPGAAGPVIARQRFARFAADGSLDVNFNPDFNGSVAAVVARPDGSALVGGSFTALQLAGSIVIGGSFGTVGGVPARNLAMLNDNGSVSTTFQPNPNGAVNALLMLPDGRFFVGGAFTSIGGVARNRLARFNADGTLDTSFVGGSTGTVHALALQPDGKYLVGGAEGLRRYNANGSEDGTYAASNTSPITALAVQGDGRILYAVNRATLGRFEANGRPDATFAPPAGPVLGLSLQADGRIVVAGTAGRIARLNPDGTLDASFAPAPNNTVTAVALQPDGRVLAGGRFTVIGGAPRAGLARLAATGSAAQVLGVSANRTTISWSRTGPVGEIAAATFELSSDRVAWTRLGTGTRTLGGANWQLGGLNLPASGVFYLRARGIAPSAAGTSSGVYETVREFNFSNPLGSGTASGPVQTPVAVAAPPLDPFTGIAARSVVTIVPGEGSVEIFAAPRTADGAGAARLANLSTRGRLSADAPLILGFAVAGTESRSLLIRAAGPALAQFGVSDALAAVRLQIYDTAGTLIAAAEPGAISAAATAAAGHTGAFPLPAGSADSATLVTLAPGTYTAQVMVAGTATTAAGVALVEIYDAGTGAGARLVNVSSRGATGTGSAALISGFVLAGDTAQRVLLRGVGPGLAAFGATNVVADPSVSLFDATGYELGGNDNWVSSVLAISGTARRVGAFALTPGSMDAAVLATLPPGAYTVQLRGGTAGNALLEIYDARD
jgi:uncharacterized delta-60 repeat protein